MIRVLELYEVDSMGDTRYGCYFEMDDEHYYTEFLEMSYWRWVEDTGKNIYYLPNDDAIIQSRHDFFNDDSWDMYVPLYIESNCEYSLVLD